MINKFSFALLTSIILNLIIIILGENNSPSLTLNEKPQKRLIIRNIGEDKGTKNIIAQERKVLTTKQLAFKTLDEQEIYALKRNKREKKLKKLLRPLKRKENSIVVNKNTFKDFNSDSLDQDSIKRLLDSAESTQAQFSLEVPKGVKESELNKHELVFYSFRKRTAMTYLNSFQKELNRFERRNPRLQFPLTRAPQKIAGKITYDKNGDILSIKTLKWSDISTLQDFFMDVLKSMNSLPNPPEAILNTKDQFAVNFVLTIN